jgi:hypothetical protein
MMSRRVGGWAAAAAALLSGLFSTVFFVFTHGSGSGDRHTEVLGFDSATVCRASALVGVALVVAMWGLRAELTGRGRRLAVAANVALVGAGGVLAGRILQCWLAHPDRDFEGLRVTLGFYVEALGYAGLGCSLLWIGAAGADQLPRMLSLGSLLAGVGLWLATLGPTFLVPEHSGRDLGWDVTATLMGLPAWCGLLLVGASLLRPAQTPVTALD